MSDLLNGSPANSPNPSATPATAPPTGQPADGGGWLTSLPEELRSVAEHKGWKDPADALRSYQHLEQTFGADKAGRTLMLPKDGEDAESYDKIYQALGRPAEVGGYELNSLFGEDVVDENVLDTMAKTMHEAGLSKAQAQKMGTAYQEMYKSAVAEAEARLISEIDDLKISVPAATQEMAKRGFKMFRLPEEEAAQVSQALVRALGPKTAVELFARLGSVAGEDRPLDGDRPGGGGDAQARIDQLLADKDFSARYLAGEPQARQTIDELYNRVRK